MKDLNLKKKFCRPIERPRQLKKRGTDKTADEEEALRRMSECTSELLSSQCISKKKNA
jgi:hypothetical protein